jgi:hypothetical protein
LAKGFVYLAAVMDWFSHGRDTPSLEVVAIDMTRLASAGLSSVSYQGRPGRSKLVASIGQHGRNHMLRFALSALALAGMLATTQPVQADPAAAAADQAQPAPTVGAQPAP